MIIWKRFVRQEWADLRKKKKEHDIALFAKEKIIQRLLSLTQLNYRFCFLFTFLAGSSHDSGSLTIPPALMLLPLCGRCKPIWCNYQWVHIKVITMNKLRNHTNYSSMITGASGNEKNHNSTCKFSSRANKYYISCPETIRQW